MSITITESLCPWCRQQLLVTTTNLKHGDQLALDRTERPNCSAYLVRDADGHIDRGWRLADKPDDRDRVGGSLDH